MAQSSTNKRPRPQRGAKHERLVNPGCQKFNQVAWNSYNHKRLR